MGKKAAVFKQLKEILRGIPWAIFAGTAFEIYTNGEREGRDIDIIIPGWLMNDAAKRFGVEPILQTRNKGGVEIVNDRYLETEIDGVIVEVVGDTEKIVIDGYQYLSTTPEAIKKLFIKVVEREYQGVEIPIVPVEELIAQKMIFDRSGKWQDKEDVKLLISKFGVDKGKLRQALDRWGMGVDKQIEVYQKLGFKYE